MIVFRSGIIARFIMHTEPLFGTLLTICLSYLSDCTMHGSSTSVTGIYVGLTLLQGRGKLLAVDVTVNAMEMKPARYYVIIAMLITT